MSDERRGEKPDCGEQAHEGKARPTQATILIVDDDQAVRNLLHEALSLYGYRVIAAATLKEADESLQRLEPEAIGLVVTDIHLTADPQGQEGYDLYRRWTAARPTLHFLLISGDPDSRALPAVQFGAVPFLLKPFTLDELLKVVRTLVGG